MTRFVPSFLVLALAGALGACGPTGMSGPSMNNHMGSSAATASDTVESTEILDREPRANNTKVKHILISWKDKKASDERGQARTKRDAEGEVRSLMKQITAGADFDTLMKAHSEDPGSAATAEAYDVSPDAQLVIEFRQLGLRLDVNEVGVVETDFGYHIIKRVE
ncbi:MAG TPA: peptidylprolyl isomerase [Kofleriaceae bacterium]|nr:peptidylprolyl isomerase [Kofleriaceae bacterium]